MVAEEESTPDEQGRPWAALPAGDHHGVLGDVLVLYAEQPLGEPVVLGTESVKCRLRLHQRGGLREARDCGGHEIEHGMPSEAAFLVTDRHAHSLASGQARACFRRRGDSAPAFFSQTWWTGMYWPSLADERCPVWWAIAPLFAP
jgi:hypothetical protein